MSEPTRRAVLAGAAGLTAVTVLAACGDDDSDTGPTDTAATGGATGGVLATRSEIPVGGGKVLKDVVVTQPTAGEFKAFSSICTHQGCPVAEVGDTINCACHGSQFSIADGSVVKAPATQPLPARQLTVDGDDLTVV